MVVRKLDDLGRIVIPKEMRTALFLHDGDGIGIQMDGNKLTLEKHTSTCDACNSDDDVMLKNRAYLCGSCRKKLS